MSDSNEPQASNAITRRGLLAAGGVGITASALGATGAGAKASRGLAPASRALEEAYDYIVVGGGTAGPVVAARLSEDPTISVLLVEAGPENNIEAGEYAAGAFQMWGPRTNWGFHSSPQAGLGDRKIMQPRGKVIGGSAAINVGSWSRGTQGNYESWGLDGWDWESVLATYKKIEDSQREDRELRGGSGPMRLEDTPEGTDLTGVFKEAAIEAGIGTTSDRNAKEPVGFDIWETIFPGGRRHNTERGYLDRARSRKNLTVLTEAHVTRVRFEGKRASGITYFKGDATREVSAEREVILCAGAINSPQLLMLSGIGPAKHLREHGIEVVADLPAVGSNLADHLRVGFGALSPEGKGRSIYADPSDPAQLETWRSGRYGPLALAENTSAAFVRSHGAAPHPDIELMYTINPPMEMRKANPGRAGWFIQVGLVQPASRGTVRLASSDPRAKATYDPNYLGDPADIQTYTRGVRMALAHVETEALRPFTDPSTLTLAVKARDEEIEAHIRATAESIYHPACSARMGPDGDETAALDSQCRVKGVKGLRVADASAIPSLISGHTMAPTILIAERVAELIKAR